jgi:hypothetical protein
MVHWVRRNAFTLGAIPHACSEALAACAQSPESRRWQDPKARAAPSGAAPKGDFPGAACTAPGQPIRHTIWLAQLRGEES